MLAFTGLCSLPRSRNKRRNNLPLQLLPAATVTWILVHAQGRREHPESRNACRDHRLKIGRHGTLKTTGAQVRTSKQQRLQPGPPCFLSPGSIQHEHSISAPSATSKAPTTPVAARNPRPGTARLSPVTGQGRRRGLLQWTDLPKAARRPPVQTWGSCRTLSVLVAPFLGSAMPVAEVENCWCKPSRSRRWKRAEHERAAQGPQCPPESATLATFRSLRLPS